jgi:hypothetical protein
MPELTLTVTAEERAFLEQHLEDVLKETRIEEHRTRTITYRKGIVEREKVILSLLAKLKPPPASAT